MWINPPYDTEIFCIWCKKEWILPKKEIWAKPCICPYCHKEMGRPMITHGSIWDPKVNSMVKYHKAHSYYFQAILPKGKVLPLIEYLAKNNGYCHAIMPYPRSWRLNIELAQALNFEGVQLENPAVLEGQ